MACKLHKDKDPHDDAFEQATLVPGGCELYTGVGEHHPLAHCVFLHNGPFGHCLSCPSKSLTLLCNVLCALSVSSELIPHRIQLLRSGMNTKIRFQEYYSNISPAYWSRGSQDPGMLWGFCCCWLKTIWVQILRLLGNAGALVSKPAFLT